MEVKKNTMVIEVYGCCEESILVMTATRASLISHKFDKAELGLVSKSDS